MEESLTRKLIKFCDNRYDTLREVDEYGETIDDSFCAGCPLKNTYHHHAYNTACKFAGVPYEDLLNAYNIIGANT